MPIPIASLSTFFTHKTLCLIYLTLQALGADFAGQPFLKTAPVFHEKPGRYLHQAIQKILGKPFPF